MKRLFLFALTGVLCFGMFAGCGKPDVTQEPTEETQEPTEENQEPTEENQEPTEETKDIFADSMQKSDPSQDDVYNLLLVGSSAFYYQVEEMVGVAKAAGINLNIYHLYKSSCTLQQSYDAWKNDEPIYTMRHTNESGLNTKEGMTLLRAMQFENWDAIALCGGGASKMRALTAQNFVSSRKEYLDGLVGLFRKEFPMSKLYWQQHNAYQIGYFDSKFVISTPEQQQADAETYRQQAILVAQTYDMQWIPRGDAGQIARANPVVGDTLCARRGINGGKGDNSHEGDIGGGQYVTACTWFEVLFDQSCIGNTWRPHYELSEEKIVALQQAAHEAVAAMEQ